MALAIFSLSEWNLVVEEYTLQQSTKTEYYSYGHDYDKP